MAVWYASIQGNDGSALCGCVSRQCIWGPVINVTTSGILSCTSAVGCYTDGTNDYSWSFSGVNASFPLGFVSGFSWSGVNGSITINKFSSNDNSCVGLIASSTLSITWPITCQGDNDFRITSPGTVFVSAFGYDWIIFANGSAFPLGTPIPNANLVGSCVAGGPLGAAGYGGNLSVDLP